MWTMLGLLAFACSDYQVKPDAGHGGSLDTAADSGPVLEESYTPMAEGQAHADLQRASWGARRTQCRIEVAFLELAEEAPGAPGAVIAMPEEPGTCAYTAFSPEETQAAEPLGARGSLDAGESVQLADGDGAFALPRVERNDGIRYSRLDCTEGSWPAGRAFDLSAPGTARAAGLPAFTMTQAVVVGPDVARLQPADALLVGEELQQQQDSPLVLEWREVGPRPIVEGAPTAPDEMVVLRHMEVSEQRIFEALACRPALSGYLEIPPEELQRFAPDTDGRTYVNAQVELRWSARLDPASWGPMFSQGMTTFSGILKLRGPG